MFWKVKLHNYSQLIALTKLMDGSGNTERKTKYIFLRSVDRESRHNSCKWPTWRSIIFFLQVYFKSLHVFRATSCSSSGESIVSVQYLVCVTLCRWPSSMQVEMDLHTKSTYAVLNRKFYDHRTLVSVGFKKEAHIRCQANTDINRHFWEILEVGC
jgi:hypothetical protein